MSATLTNPFNPDLVPVALNDAAKRDLGNHSTNEILANILANLANVNFGGAVKTNISITPTVDTSAYTANDVLFDTTAIANAVRVSGGSAKLESLVLLDKDDNAAAQIDLVFFNANVALGAANGAPSVSDANAAKILGIVAVPSANFIDVGGSKLATVLNIGLQLTPATGTTIYVAGIARGTPTQTAGGIVINFGFAQE